MYDHVYDILRCVWSVRDCQRVPIKYPPNKINRYNVQILDTRLSTCINKNSCKQIEAWIFQISNTSAAGLSTRTNKKSSEQINLRILQILNTRAVHACRSKFFRINGLLVLEISNIDIEHIRIRDCQHVPLKKIWRPAKQGAVASARPRDRTLGRKKRRSSLSQ